MNMMDVFENWLAYIEDNRHVWTQQIGDYAIDGIHWMMVNSARVALEQYTHAREPAEVLSKKPQAWPTLVNGEVRQYVDAFAAD